MSSYSIATYLTTTFADQSIQKGPDGTTTVWLPISSAWPTNSGCSTQVFGINSTLAVAYDPYWKASISSKDAACIPPQATLWGYPTGTDTRTVTSLGPTFLCPAAYTVASTSIINPMTTKSFCCPSAYSVSSVSGSGDTIFFQCFSTPKSGQVVSLKTQGSDSSWTLHSLTVTSSFSYAADQIDGYNIMATSTSSTSSTDPGVTAITSAITAATTAPAVTPPTNSNVSSGSSLSTGAIAGIAISGALVLILAAVALFWCLRHRRPRSSQSHTESPGDMFMRPAMAAPGTGGDGMGGNFINHAAVYPNSTPYQHARPDAVKPGFISSAASPNQYSQVPGTQQPYPEPIPVEHNVYGGQSVQQLNSYTNSPPTQQANPYAHSPPQQYGSFTDPSLQQRELYGSPVTPPMEHHSPPMQPTTYHELDHNSNVVTR